MAEQPEFQPAAWLARSWERIRTRTDTSVLGVLRFLGLLYGPIDRDLPTDRALRKALGYRLAGHVGWRHALGGITYLLLIILVVTGVLLALYYRPSAQEAYPSIQYIVTRTSFGWLIRDVHRWAADLVVIFGVAHLIRIFVDAVYRPPRETNWLVGLLLLVVVLLFGASGYLLPWDQSAYWTVTEALTALERVAIVGGLAAALLTGDVIVSGATLSRFFVLHAILLPWLTMALLVLHFAMLRRHGVAPLRRGGPERPGPRFFPYHLLRSFSVAVLVLAVLASLAVLFPRPVGAPANPYAVPERLVSTWIPATVMLGVVRHLGAWGLGALVVAAVALALVPLIDQGQSRRARRAVHILAGAVLAGLVVGWLAGRRIDTAAALLEVPASGGETEAPAVTLPAAGPDAPGPPPPDAGGGGGR